MAGAPTDEEELTRSYPWVRLPSVGHSSPRDPPLQPDLESIRSQFPALARTHNGHPVAYFDGPGGTQVPRCVVEAMSEYLYHHNANRHWGFPTSDETDEIIDGAREAVADLLNVEPDEVAFGPNMTTLTFHLSRALGREWGPGDTVVVTELDHHANIDPWKALEKERGVTVRMTRLDPETGQLDMGHLQQLLDDGARLLAIGGASNALGTINNVERVCRAAREVGAATFVDAVHYAPHELVDVREFGCDFLVCSAYKFYGPHLGILYGKKGLMDSLDFPKLQPAPEVAPDRAETGTQNHEGIAGTAAPSSSWLPWERASVGARDWRTPTHCSVGAAANSSNSFGMDFQLCLESRFTVPPRTSRGHRPSPLPSREFHPPRSVAIWPTWACSCRTATSTPAPRWSAWVSRSRALSASAAPAIPPVRRSTVLCGGFSGLLSETIRTGS